MKKSNLEVYRLLIMSCLNKRFFLVDKLRYDNICRRVISMTINCERGYFECFSVVVVCCIPLLDQNRSK